MAILCILTYMFTMMLPEGGAYLPKIVKVTESVSIMQVEPIAATIHDTVLMMPNIHTMTFHETFREKVSGTQRPRINESCIDPDLLEFDFKEVTKIIDLWKVEGVDESLMANLTYDIERWRTHDI